MTLLFITDYPDPSSEQDGMMQRIMAIDSRFADVERAYLKISFVGNIPAQKEHRGECLTLYRLNFFCHFFSILRLALCAECIYLHSVGNALAMLPFYFFRKMVTDMHGAVPEEFALAGKRLAALRYAPVEWVAVRYSRAIVTVSRAMAEHLRTKYSLRHQLSFNVPIFDDMTVLRPTDHDDAAAPRVIYAGGAQVWQNVDLMLRSIGRAKARCDYTILTGDVGTFREKVAALGLEGISIASVPKDAVYGYYARADYGFVLRDDTLVNRVACPTKLVEYLSCGVVPIISQPLIGDFKEYGYSYISLEKFVNGELPTPDELEQMRANNYQVIAAMKRGALKEMQRLVAFCLGKDRRVTNGA